MTDGALMARPRLLVSKSQTAAEVVSAGQISRFGRFSVIRYNALSRKSMAWPEQKSWGANGRVAFRCAPPQASAK
jgi:hypothetical protein